ncbi:MAG: rod shape-determining protein MreD [Pseudomonadota bacterium]
MTDYPFSPLRAGLFVLLALGCMYFNLMPIQTTAETLVMPDILLGLAAAWVIRRPHCMPLLLTAALFLLSDFLMYRPVGLWAVIALLIVEFMRGQRDVLRNRPFPAEWAAFAGALAVGLIVEAVVLQLTLVARPSGDIPLQVFAVTVVAYPVLALLLHSVFRVRAPKPAERSRRLGRVV